MRPVKVEGQWVAAEQLDDGWRALTSGEDPDVAIYGTIRCQSLAAAGVLRFDSRDEAEAAIRHFQS
jgi:hypothetical protein